MLRLPRNSNLAKPPRGRANGRVSETVPKPPPYRRRVRGGLRTVRKSNSRTACYPPAGREWIQHLAKVLRLPRNLCLTLRKCCESAAPATKSILDLAKVLRLPRNSDLAKPARGRANGPVSETVPRPPPHTRRVRGGLRTVRKSNSRTAPTFLHLAILQLEESGSSTLQKHCACHQLRPCETSARPCQWARLRDRSETASVQASRPRWFAHCPEVQFTHSANVSTSCYPPARREWIQHLAKVLRLPRNLYLTLRKCCESAAPATQLKPYETCARPCQWARLPEPPPYRRRVRGGLRTVRKSNSRTACYPPAGREWIQHLAKVLRLPRNLYLTLRKCCESAAPATKSILDLAKVLRLPRN